MDGPAWDALVRTNVLRRQNIEALRRRYALVLAGCNQAASWLDWLAGQCAVGGLARLVERASQDVCRGVDAAVSGDQATVNDIARSLMEVEALLREFALNIPQVHAWNELGNDHMEGRQFSFGRVVDRLRQAAGEEQGIALPDKVEYAAHSADLHPTPRGRIPSMGVAPDDRDGLLEASLREHVEHVKRVVGAGHQLVEAAPRDSSVLKVYVDDEMLVGAPPPSLDVWPAVQGALGDIDEQMKTWLGSIGVERLDRAPRKRGESFFRVATSQTDSPEEGV